MALDASHHNLIDRAVKVINKAIPNISGIYLFGSFGTEYETASSDVDLAVLSESPLDSVRLWDVAQEVARALDRDCQLVDLRQASTVFRFQVVTTGSRIYHSDAQQCDLFEHLSMSMYLRFNEERAEILENFKKRSQN